MEKSTATDLLERFWDGRLPINPRVIAAALDMRVVGLNAGDILKGLSGALHWQISEGQEPQLLCRFNPNDSRERQNFTIAHEIGHFALGHLTPDKPVFRDTSEVFTGRVKDWQEVEANRFAAELLMPEKLVKSSIQRDGVNRIQDLAARFGVSQSAMHWRLVNLGMLSSI